MPKTPDGNPFDPFAIEARTTGTAWARNASARSRTTLLISAFRPGYLRAVGPGWTNWAVETFMDEAARMAGADPVAFRTGLLDGAGRNAGSAPNAVGGAKRQAAVLKRAAEKAGWGAAMPMGTGLGVATTFGQARSMPTWVACVARVRVTAAAAPFQSKSSRSSSMRAPSFIQTVRSRKSKAALYGASAWRSMREPNSTKAR